MMLCLEQEHMNITNNKLFFYLSKESLLREVDDTTERRNLTEEVASYTTLCAISNAVGSYNFKHQLDILV